MGSMKQTMKHLIFICVLLCSLFFYGCKQEGSATANPSFTTIHEYDSKVNYLPAEHWQKAAEPEALGWSSQKLGEVQNFVESLSTDALIIIQNGVVIAAWGHVTENYNCRSIRKSLLSALYGIHVETGEINLQKTLAELGIDDLEPLTPEEKKATISDLLSARSGVYHPAAYETKTMRETRPERGSHPPGTFWFYNNWDFNALLTIFQQETRTNFFEDFEKNIASPLRMEQFHLKNTRFYWDRSKSMHPAYLFEMSALDLARFGLLYLREGRWGEKQIIPVDWVKLSTAPHTLFNKSKSPRRGYGYLWYAADEGYYAAGKGGSRIMIVPDRDLVIVHLVNAEIDGRRVKAAEFWRLLDLILDAQKT